MVKILIFRILGNDLQGIHGNNQTITNLKFTLENESEFPNTTKMFLLNRIYDLDKKNKIIKMLDSYNYKYLDIPFEIEEYKKIIYDKNIDKLIKNHKNVRSNKNIFIGLREHNLYLVNNNGSRNYCIEYGKRKGFDWVFPLDSNSYFTDYHFKEIYKILKKDNKVEYLIIPQVRIASGKLKNEDIFFSKDIIENLNTNEPQIAFKNISKIIFNSKIPYGASPKAELLRVLRVPGRWSGWLDNKKYYDIKDRPKQNVNYKLIGKVIRLNPQEKNNGKDNFNNRMVGLYRFVKYIRNTEGFDNNLDILERFTENKKLDMEYKDNYLLILLFILLFLFLFKKFIFKNN